MFKYYIFVSIFLVISCSSGSNGDNDFPALEFTVNQELIASPVSVYNEFVICLPKNYISLNDSSLRIANQEIQKDETAYIKLKLLNIFQSDDQSSCIISLVHNQEVLSILNEEYLFSLEENFNTDNIIRAQFSINNINIVQYLITNSQIVSFKLFFKAKNQYFQIDYFIPLSSYEKELKKIESSIGSISLALNKEVK